MNRSHHHPRLAAAVLAVALAACGGAGPEAAGASARPTGRATASRALGAAGCTGSGAHDRHAAAGLGCAVCHGDGGDYLFAAYAYPGGASTAGGTILVGAAPGQTTCSVGCHAPLGSPPTSVIWATPGPLECTACHALSALVPAHPAVAAGAPRDACLGCHDPSQHAGGAVRLVSHPAEWMDQASAGFHAFAANQGLSPCKDCHGADLKGLANAPGCGTCHDQQQPDGTVVAWSRRCTLCHGGTDNATGAPPRATWGHAADAVRVGAHTVHVTGSALAPPFGCDTCHATPADATDPGHVGGATAGMVFGGLANLRATAAATPAWTRAGATCSNVYCHGNGFGGGTNTAPVWTGGPSQAACGACHGLPPPSPHPAVSSPSLAACSGCHPATVDVNGSLIAPSAGGKHLDGTVEATGGHEASWMDPASAGFHAFSADLGIASCQSCHGANLDGVNAATSVACASCHRAGGTARDFTTCIACHGGAVDVSGAPPVATWGHAGDPARGGGALDPMRVGAHTAHVAGGPLAAPMACDACHPTPAALVSPGHIANGGLGKLAFGAVASASGATPSFSRSTGTCSGTYCHGATIRQQELVPGSNPRGSNVAPLWTSGTSQATCGTCHGLPPDTGMHFQHVVTGQYGFNLPCNWCHAGFTETVVTPSLHVNGTKDVILSSDSAAPGNAGSRITGGWTSANCHNAVACHGMMY